MRRAIIAVVATLVSCVAGTPTLGVIIPYEFLRDDSILTVDGTFTFFIEGSFDLVYDLDTGAAFFQQVNATFDREVAYWGYPGWLYTDNLNVIFQLTELESVYVSETQIDFLLEKNIPRYPNADIHLSVTFIGDWLEMTGYFGDAFPDGGWYNLNAAAVVVPEPTSVFLLCGGVLFVKKGTFRARL